VKGSKEVPWRVVVVDDDSQMRSLVSDVLSADGDFRVVGAAGDGAAGVEITSRQQPDLVLLDWQMPVLDGLAALPQLRRVAPDATIVVLSGAPPEQVREKAMAAGADAFRSKSPDMPGGLAAEMRRLLGDRLAVKASGFR
jgi:CheY-like chemotaxis protein